MKSRFGFVSNSSSSSFVVLADSLVTFVENKDIPDWVGRSIIVDSNFGHSQFGWERVQYRYVEDKICWAFLQSSYVDNMFHDMITSVIKEVTGAIDVQCELDTGDYNAYIDHQSIGAGNELIFASDESLKRFLFSEYSYVQGGNDNG